MLSSPYTDQITFLSDRSWVMAYSPKSGGLQLAANVALFHCMEDQEPLLVLQHRSHVEAEAAHIIGKEARGPLAWHREHRFGPFLRE